MTILNTPWQKKITERLVRYAKFWTTSDRHSETCPSTARQWDLARHVLDELKALGVKDAVLDDNCYLVARLPASPGREAAPTLGFMAHFDTSEEVSGENVAPRVHENYDGGVIELLDGYRLDPAENPELSAYKGSTVITSDGRTLLGADDKGGIAIILTAVERLLSDPQAEHGPVELLFTPDEEIGRGVNKLDVKALRSTACYTIDGDSEGIIEAECFYAYRVVATFKGISTHPGTARGRLVNAISMAMRFCSLFPQAESPEATDGRFGYYMPLGMTGGVETATLEILIRDFESAGAERRVAALETFARAVEAAFPGGGVKLAPEVQYTNMLEHVGKDPRVLELLRAAVRKTGIEPVESSIRGGTDGSRLSALGIPTPNIFTGGRAYHSRLEWAAENAMARSCEVVLNLTELWGKE